VYAIAFSLNGKTVTGAFYNSALYVLDVMSPAAVKSP